MKTPTRGAAETLTASVRVRLTPTMKTALEHAAGREQRSPSSVARRAIERELERMRERQDKAA